MLTLLTDSATAQTFIDACLEALKPGGVLLLGDVANHDKQHRFLQSEHGKRLQAEYDARRSTLPEEYVTRNKIFNDMDPIQPFLCDRYILDLLARLRQQGYETFLLPQAPELPFSYTREDILVWSPA